MKKKLAVIMCAVMLISTAIISIKAVGAGTEVTLGDLTIKGENLEENTDYSYDSTARLLTIKSGKAMTISANGASEGGVTQLDRIEVDAAGVDVNLTFDKLKINRGGNSFNSAAFKINAAKKVTITLEKENLLASTDGFAGLQNGSIPIEINGTGSLKAAGGYGGAGIGGGYGDAGEHITISGSAKVEAIGYNGGAGIGGGENGSGNDINIIDSAQVTAGGHFTNNSDKAGAGIGGGYNGSAESIKIGNSNPDNKGKVEVTAIGYEGSAGIGGGYGGSGESIYIYNGEVTATGTGGAGIGGGDGGKGESIYIYDGTVKAYGSYWDSTAKKYWFGGGAGIGGGRGGDGKSIYIYGGTVEAESMLGAGIGGGGGINSYYYYYDDKGEKVRAVKVEDCKGGNGESIYIYGGDVTATCKSQNNNSSIGYIKSSGSAGIGGGSGGYAKDITIKTDADGKVTATGGLDGGAGIGGGKYYNGSYTEWNPSGPPEYVPVFVGGNADNIKIGGSGTVNAYGNDGSTTSSGGGAGIGGGKGGNATNITIGEIDGNSCEVTINAKGGYGGAGIGGGQSYSYGYTDYANGGKYVTEYGGGNATEITINGGKKITATSHGSGAGIGGGSGGNADTIAISGGVEVYAESDGGGAGIGGGIGGGSGGNGRNITIDSSGIITAKSTSTSSSGAGIGGGDGGNGENITIKGGTITAESEGSGAGIGGGRASYCYDNGEWKYKGGDGENIIINGGTITAKGSSSAAGIGGGSNGSAERITITGGTITAESGMSGAGIGGVNAEGIKISGGNVTATAGGNGPGTGIGCTTVWGGTSSVTDIEISGGNVTATANGYGNCIGIGGGTTQTDIKIISGTVSTVYENEKTGSVSTPMVGIGSSSGATTIEIGKDADVTAVGTNGGISATGTTVKTDETTGDEITITSSVEITGGKVSTVYEKTNEDGTITPNGPGINGTTVNISGNDTEVTAESTYSTGITGSEITITAGTVTAKGGNDAPGISGTDVYIGVEDKTTSTSYPWVYTNEINSTNDHSDSYHGIIFNDNYKENYGNDVDGTKTGEVRQEHKPDGVVYGNVSLAELEKPYVLESGETLTVHTGGTLTTGNAEGDKKLKLEDGATLYLEKDATLDKYQNISGYQDEGNGSKILHENHSNPAEPGNAETTCTICGSPVPHKWRTDWDNNTTHHWHNCDADDCSVLAEAVECSITENSQKNGYGEHKYGAPAYEYSKLIFTCEDCGYTYSVEKDKISIKKVGKDGESKNPLAGAEFELYGTSTDEETGEEIQTKVGEATSTLNEGDTEAVAVFTITGGINLGQTYYIKETQAPADYAKSDTVYTVKFNAIVSDVPDESDEIEVTVTYGTLGSDDPMTADIPTCVNEKIDIEAIQIIKVDEEINPLEGAVFGLYSNVDCTEQVGSGTSGIDGTVSFEITDVNTTYYIKEITAPAGYELSTYVFTAKVGTDGKVTYGKLTFDNDGNAVYTPLDNIPTCVNTKIVPGDIHIKKVDDKGAALPGATFGLYKEGEDGTFTGIGSGTSDDNGMVSFTLNEGEEIELNTNYMIKETDAPTGFKLSTREITVNVGADGKVKYDGSEIVPEYKNEKIDVEAIQIIKVDEENNPLPGAIFGLYSDVNLEPLATDISSSEGMVSFETTEVNKTYYIKEITAPEGYELSTDVFTATVGEDGTVIYGTGNLPVCVNKAVTSEPITPDPIQVIVIDGDTKEPLPGATFELSSIDRMTITGTTELNSENMAIVSFTEGIEVGKSYIIRQIEAPDGYMLSDKIYTASVDEEGNVTYDYDTVNPKAVPIYENYKIEVYPIQIIKVDGDGNALAGAEFGLYRDADCTALAATGTTAINAENKAVVSFTTGIEPGNTYYIKEITAPAGYELSTDVFTATVGADGKVTYEGSTNIPVCKNEKSTSPDEPVTPPDEPVTPPDEPVTPPDEPTPPVEPYPPAIPYPPVVPISPVVTPTVTESDTEEEIISDEPYFEDVSSAAGINADSECIDHFNSSKNCSAVIILIASFAVGFILRKKTSK